jgi:hypothetical protein
MDVKLLSWNYGQFTLKLRCPKHGNDMIYIMQAALGPNRTGISGLVVISCEGNDNCNINPVYQ